MNKRGVALILIFMVIVVLLTLSIAMMTRSATEARTAQRCLESTQAFWLAEAGLSRVQEELRIFYDDVTSIPQPLTSKLGPGGYFVEIQALPPDYFLVKSHGVIPYDTSYRAERIIEAKMHKTPIAPQELFDKVIFTTHFESNDQQKDIAFSVGGDVLYCESNFNPQAVSTISGTVTKKRKLVDPFPVLNFERLREISKKQGNYHTSADINGPFPIGFWYRPGVPNIIYLEGASLSLTGNITVGGFIVMADTDQCLTLVHNATTTWAPRINGVVYSRGSFNAHGSAALGVMVDGGSAALGVMVDGGIWAGVTTLDADTIINYNAVYMKAIKDLDITDDVTIEIWRDTQNPYLLEEKQE